MIRQDWSSLKKLLFFQMAAGGGAAVEATATGNPLTFVTDLARPLKSLLIPFTPQQEGTGDPSPQNIRSILPWNGLTVFGGGKNLLKYTVGQTKQNNGVDYEVLSDGGQSCEGTATATSYSVDSLRTVVHAGSYTVSVSGAVNMKTVVVKNGAYFRQISGSGYSTFSVTEDTEIGCYSFANNGDTVDETIYVQLEVGQTATAYKPYKPITETAISFPPPVYGGEHEAVSGALKSAYASDELTGLNVASYGTASTDIPYVRMTTQSVIKNNGEVLCDSYKTLKSVPQQGNSGCRISNQTLFIYDDRFTSESVAKELLTANPIQCVYELSTPQEIQLTPAQTSAIVGNNTIWSDADGSMTATYLKKG